MPVCRRAELVLPLLDGLGGCLLGSNGARQSALGEHEQPGSLVAWVRAPLDVAALGEVVDELGGGLLGDPEMDGEICGGGVAGADASEGEAVRGSDVVEAPPLDV